MEIFVNINLPPLMLSWFSLCWLYKCFMCSAMNRIFLKTQALSFCIMTNSRKKMQFGSAKFMSALDCNQVQHLGHLVLQICRTHPTNIATIPVSGCQQTQNWGLSKFIKADWVYSWKKYNKIRNSAASSGMCCYKEK